MIAKSPTSPFALSLRNKRRSPTNPGPHAHSAWLLITVEATKDVTDWWPINSDQESGSGTNLIIKLVDQLTIYVWPGRWCSIKSFGQQGCCWPGISLTSFLVRRGRQGGFWSVSWLARYFVGHFLDWPVSWLARVGQILPRIFLAFYAFCGLTLSFF